MAVPGATAQSYPALSLAHVVIPGLGPAWTDLITIPLFTGIIGYITNWTGVLMLFRPLDFHGVRVPGLRVIFPLLPRRVRVLPLLRYSGQIGWQGIVPSRAAKMASLAVDKGLAKLGSIGDFYRELEPDRIAEHLTVAVDQQLEHMVDTIMRAEDPQLWADVPPLFKDAVYARVRQQLPGRVQLLTGRIGENIDQLIDAKLMVVSHLQVRRDLLNSIFQDLGGFSRRQSRRIHDFIARQMRQMGPDDFVEMLRSAIKQDEWLLFLHGGVLGIAAGLLHLAIFGA